MTIAPSMPSLEEGRLWVIYMLKIHLQSLLSLIPSSFPPSLPPSLPLSPSSLPSSLYITGSEEQSILPPDVVEAYKYTFSKPGALTGPVNYYRTISCNIHQFLFPTVRKMIDIPTLIVWVSVIHAWYIVVLSLFCLPLLFIFFRVTVISFLRRAWLIVMAAYALTWL